MSFIKSAEDKLEAIFWRTHSAVDKAIAATEAAAKAEKTQIFAEAKAGLAQLQAAVSADTPELKAAAQKALSDALAVIEAIAKAHGL